jgi:sulfite reductase (NADPH) hemoprotein beta-component
MIETDTTLVAERPRVPRPDPCGSSRRFSDEEFRPLRLRNGLYIQTHAPMLRVAIPYGLLSTRQLRMLAHLARKYDRDYGHFTTRQNIQYNWPKIADVPDMLADLASVEMHAIQTSGNCIRNITADHWAGVAGDEIEDPRTASHPPVVDAASRVQLPAAQVQDRGDRRTDRPCRFRDP